MLKSALLTAGACALGLLCGNAIAQQEVKPDPFGSHAASREADLKQRYLHCSGAATYGLLARGEIALCSVVYETLLKEVFVGDFLALLVWSRQSPDTAPSLPARDQRPTEREHGVGQEAAY